MKHLMNISILALIAIIAFSQPISAKVVKLSDAEMGNIVAQAGISFSAEDKLDLSTRIDTFAYGDTDGAGNNSQAGWLSLNNINLDGSVEFHNPLTIDISTAPSESGGRVTGIDFQMNGLTVAIDSMTIESITLGGAPGEGKSFGSFAMRGMRTEITGKVRIWTE